MAKVDSVDGNEVTLSVGGGMGAAPDGNAQQTPGEMTQESALLTINDESVIKVQGFR